MKVWFIGGHTAGKTSLVRLVADRYKLQVLPEGARIELAQMKGGLESIRSNIDAVSTYQRRVFERQLRAEREAGDDFVSDRAFDNLAYAAEHAECFAEIMESAELNAYIDQIRWSMGVVFFVRPLPTTSADGTRPTADLDMASVHRIDGMVKLLLELFRIPYVPIETSSFKDRWTTVQYVLNLKFGFAPRTGAPEISTP